MSFVTYNNTKEHTVNILGVGEVTLPVIKINDKIAIASFNIIDNYPLITKLASVLADKISLYNPEAILCVEAKSLPLTYAVCKELNEKGFDVFYKVARKSEKVYMENTRVGEVSSITTKTPQKIFIDGKDIEALKNKRLVVLDDVISTGETINTLLTMLKKEGITPTCVATVLFEADASKDSVCVENKECVFALGHIPLYRIES